MGKDPPYQLAEINHETYVATQRPLSPFMVVPGWTLHTCVFDVMHNLFLGAGRDFGASAIRLLLEKGVFDSYRCQRHSNEMFQHLTMDLHQTFADHKLLDCTNQ